MTRPVENPVKVLERHIKLQQQQQQQTAVIEAELEHSEVPPHIQEVLSSEASDHQSDSESEPTDAIISQQTGQPLG